MINILMRRFVILVFFFLIGGAIGSVGFILMLGGGGSRYGSTGAHTSGWVKEQSADDLRRHTKYAFLAGGGIAVASVFVMLVKYDTGSE